MRGISAETVGLLAGLTIIGLAVIVMVLFASPFTGWPDDWETLLAGFAAVTVAYVTVRQIRQQVEAVRDQVKLTEQLAADERERESYAARAVLPPALSALSDYAMRCIQRQYGAQPDGDPPTVPIEVTPVIRDCIRFADEPKRRELADLLGELQVNVARLRDGQMLPQDHALDAAELYVRVSALFAYGRRTQEDDIPTLWSALSLAGIEATDHPELEQRIRAAEARFTREMNSYRE